MNRRLLPLSCAVLLGFAAIALPVQPSKASARGAAANSAHISGAEIVDYGKKFLHYRYSYSGSSPKAGFSCIGFVWYVFQHFGINMPGNLASAIVSYRHVAETDLVPGDIVFFQNTWWKGVSHVAIYIGHGQLLHAENPHRGVNISSLSNDSTDGDYWQQHYLVSERPLDGQSYSKAPTTNPVTEPKGPKAVVKVPSLNFRAGHSMDAVVVTVLPHGTAMVVEGQWRGWLHVVLSDGTTGWVVNAGVTMKRPASHPKPPPVTWKQTATVQVDGLHVHNQPSVSATILTSLRYGAKVGILKKIQGWYEIATNEHVRGWSVQRYLKTATSKPGSKTPPTRTYAVLAGVNIHSAPAVSAPVVSTTVKGETVTILKKQGSFDHIEGPNRQNGWILARFITGPATPASGPKGKQHPPSTKKHSRSTGSLTITAHLRTGPSLSAHILQWVAAGTTVGILGASGEWDHVRIPSKRTGYVFAQFIRR